MRFTFALALLIILTSCGNGRAGGPLPVIGYGSFDEVNEPLPTEGVENGVTREAVTEAAPAMIRVLINASHFTGRIHERVSITAEGGFIVRGICVLGESTVYIYEAGEEFVLSGTDDMGVYQQIIIEPAVADGRLEMIGLGRNWPNGMNPRYRGRIEVSAASGGFTVINELLLEEYLYGVIPSEMPASYGLEAAKVQAITARSFAYRQMNENRFRAYGADIDDSVISQVYNNLPENALSVEAVQATRGMVLMYDGEVIVANYFSTSGGTTANAGEVWPAGGEFPGETPPYLRARAQFEPIYIVGDLRTEENAAAFFRDLEVPGFERDFPFFRWRVRMTAAELSASINGKLGERQQANGGLIKRVDFGGVALDGPVRSIGQLRDIEVVRRGQGGNIIELILVGTASAVRVQTEFNIRSLLAPSNSQITLHNGNTLNGWAMMPSAFFTMEIERDGAGNLTAVTFYGGGHGHGVGMSQNGAKALLDLGYGYREVLMHFYPGAEIFEFGI
ncbi:MAG: SpoIID/LytB domain-containing protein [Defluviitaleaceae bacterium]|nr:SpoIID/LytB domain-containing protein [Defluviitaleaceae bacterium]